MKIFLKNYGIEIVLLIFSCVFSIWLMWHTFAYKDGSMLIATKVWSDFASHVPLIRSFSFGNNIPPEYPLFSGEPIRYHFLFYFFVGLLEKAGLLLDWALNLPSALSFTLLMMAIYLMAKTLFKSKAVGILSIILFLFNGSLSFIEFFKIHPLSSNIVSEIINNREFPSFAPYGPGTVSAFWNLNIFTNQRHLALPFAVCLLMILWIIHQEQKREKKKLYKIPIIWGVILGILLYAHSSMFIMAVTVLAWLFFLLPNQRFSIFLIGLTGFIISLPRALFLKETTTFAPQIKIGYLIADKLTLPNFLEYWFLNLGLFLLLLPLGFLLSSKLAKKVLIAFTSLFIVGNTIQFSPEIAGNHKFFNVFVAMGNMFVAFALIKIWSKDFTKILVPFLIFFLILSGIIDFFPIKNDSKITIADYPKNPDAAWIINHTPRDAIFLNSSYIYHPASLAGRKIFLGWPYFSWSLGYNTTVRSEQAKNILSTRNKKNICNFLNANKLSFVDLGQQSADFPFDINFWQENFKPIYQNPTTKFAIYQTVDICKSI